MGAALQCLSLRVLDLHHLLLPVWALYVKTPSTVQMLVSKLPVGLNDGLSLCGHLSTG